jgi:2-keto-4-pentenoate hydratase/2-oxohepta-3-ene-1,7-dioic acid hydratase in catechol pathway
MATYVIQRQDVDISSTDLLGLVRFAPRSNPSTILIGQPRDGQLDVGLALRDSQEVEVDVYSGSSVLSPGEATGRQAIIERLFAPLPQSLVGTIRCIGLNYRQHAAEVKMEIPKTPSLFLKPAAALGDPWPARTMLPRISQQDDSADYESEVAVVIGKTAKNVSEADALDYVLGYTAANDISSRTAQFATTQWDYSKGFDGSLPLGPLLVSPSLIPDPSKLRVKGSKNGQLLQDCGTDDLIFSIPKLISFLSQSTTLSPGTVIITGTPAGVGLARGPKVTLRAGDEFRVSIESHIGTLVSVFENEA